LAKATALQAEITKPRKSGRKGNVVAAGAAATAAFLQDPSAYADVEIVLLVTGANLSPEVLRRAVT
jgi:hypothetical protein